MAEEYASIRSRLEVIKEASQDLRERIGEVLERNNRIEIATMLAEPYAQDLFRLMRETAEVANPILKQMGITNQSIDSEIEEYVKILSDNTPVLYFASVNIEAKYSKNHYGLTNVAHWASRLEASIEKIESFLDSGVEKKELEGLFSKLDETTLPENIKRDLKNEFLAALNRLNKRG